MFEVAGDAYDRFMGRYSQGLSAQLADLAGVSSAMRLLDVGCGPGALVGELVARVGPHLVAAVDPSEPFVGAARLRYPGVDVRVAVAEHASGATRRTTAPWASFGGRPGSSTHSSATSRGSPACARGTWHSCS